MSYRYATSPPAQALEVYTCCGIDPVTIYVKTGEKIGHILHTVRRLWEIDEQYGSARTPYVCPYGSRCAWCYLDFEPPFGTAEWETLDKEVERQEHRMREEILGERTRPREQLIYNLFPNVIREEVLADFNGILTRGRNGKFKEDPEAAQHPRRSKRLARKAATRF
jgi:hypothetical protein